MRLHILLSVKLEYTLIGYQVAPPNYVRIGWFLGFIDMTLKTS